jgi:hypothetical protein
MTNIEVLFNKKIKTYYAQIALFDAEINGAYPEWKTGHEKVVVGPHGVVIATALDMSIDVTVYKGFDHPDDHKICVSSEIIVGRKGLLVGNVIASDLTLISWPKGRTAVVVYTNKITDATKVHIYLDHLENS